MDGSLSAILNLCHRCYRCSSPAAATLRRLPSVERAWSHSVCAGWCDDVRVICCYGRDIFICFGGCCGFGKRGFTNLHHKRLAFYGRMGWLDYWQVYYVAVLKLTKSWVVMKYVAF